METILMKRDKVLIIYASWAIHNACQMADKINLDDNFSVIEIRRNYQTDTSVLIVDNPNDLTESDLKRIITC